MNVNLEIFSSARKPVIRSNSSQGLEQFGNLPLDILGILLLTNPAIKNHTYIKEEEAAAAASQHLGAEAGAFVSSRTARAIH